MGNELQRQLFHLILGLASIAMLLHFGRGFMIAAVFFTIVVGMLLINARMRGKKIALVAWFEKQFERRDAVFPGWGSACYAAGVLILLTFLTDINEIITGIFILAMGDGFSSMLGAMGKIKLPYNGRKTLEGSVAFVLSSLPAFYFVGALILPLAIVASIVESIDLYIDDNITVPIACVIFFLVI